MMKSVRAILGIATATVALVGAQPVKADIVFTLGNNPQPGEQNVLLNTGASGSTISGTLNQTGDVVNFTSATQTLIEPSNGQARVEATSGGNQVPLSDISSISLATGNFQDIIFNSHIGGTIGTAGGTETVTVTDNLGVTHPFTFDLGNGENFLTIVAINGELISSVAISYPNGFTDLRQIRISLAGAVPEPSTMALAGTGLVSLLAARMWRRRRPA